MQTALAFPLREPIPSAVQPRALVSVEVGDTVPAIDHTRRRRAVWLSIHLPNWSLHAALTALSPPERAVFTSHPLAVVDQDRRGSVLACNALAQQQGIRAGHSLNAAIALAAHVKFLPRHERHEIQCLQDVAALCQRYTSMVSLQPPNELLLEVRGSFRLFGGMPALLDLIRQDLEQRGLAPQLAIAPTAQSALWLSRVARTPQVVTPRKLPMTLSAIPVGCLNWPAATQLRLARFGVRTLGDLLRLPRGGLARRIGHGLLAELDRALGRHKEVRLPHPCPERYADRVLLDFEIETTGLLAVVLERRFERLDHFLRQRELAVSNFAIVLRHRNDPSTTLNIGLAHPTSDVAHMHQLAKVHLERLCLVAPVSELLIQVKQLKPAHPASRALFASSAGDITASPHEKQARLLEQLQSRLGAHAVIRVKAAAQHRPERAQDRSDAAVNDLPRQCPPPTRLPTRPLWLLHEPRLVIDETARAPRLSSSQEPEVIEAGWWDGGAIQRHYYRLASHRGQLCWTFQDQTRPSHWYVHGLFA